MKKIIEGILTSIGFDSWGDYVQSVFGLKIKIMMLHIYGAIIGMSWTIFLHVTENIDKFVYYPAQGIYILFFASIADFFLGIGNSISVRKEKIQSGKISRSAVRFITHVFIVGLAYNISLVWPIIFHRFIVDFILLTFILTTGWSCIENSYSLGFITKEQFEALQSVVNPTKFLNKFRDKNENKND